MHPFKKMIFKESWNNKFTTEPIIGLCYSLTINENVSTTNIGVRYSTINDIDNGNFTYTYTAFSALLGLPNGMDNITFLICSISPPAIVNMTTLIPFVWSEGNFSVSGGTCVENGECIIT